MCINAYLFVDSRFFFLAFCHCHINFVRAVKKWMTRIVSVCCCCWACLEPIPNQLIYKTKAKPDYLVGCWWVICADVYICKMRINSITIACTRFFNEVNCSINVKWQNIEWIGLICICICFCCEGLCIQLKTNSWLFRNRYLKNKAYRR